MSVLTDAATNILDSFFDFLNDCRIALVNLSLGKTSKLKVQNIQVRAPRLLVGLCPVRDTPVPEF
jgi:hypothetical protein